MAKSFTVRVTAVLLMYMLLYGIITASFNSSHALTGRQGDRIYYTDIENFINEKILSRK